MCISSCGLRARLAASCLVLLFLLVPSACLPPALPPTKKIGLVAPFEGAERDIGYDAVYAARLAIREINAAGGAGGWRLELVAYDDRGDPEFARTVAHNLAADGDVVAIIGHFQPESTTAAQPVYSEAGMPLLALGTEGETYPLPEALPETGAWIDAYRAVGPHTPTPGSYALPTYAAVTALAKAITIATTHGDPTRAAVAAALPEVEQHSFLGIICWRAEAMDEAGLVFHLQLP